MLSLHGGSSSETTFALTRSGGAISWGFNYFQNVGHSFFEPAPVTDIGALKAASSSLSFSCGRDSDGSLICFGDDRSGARDTFTFEGLRSFALGNALCWDPTPQVSSEVDRQHLRA